MSVKYAGESQLVVRFWERVGDNKGPDFEVSWMVEGHEV